MPIPVDEHYILVTEAELGARFPVSFRLQMMKSNGGELDVAGDHWWLFPFADKSDRKRLKRTCNDIVRETATARGWPSFPARGVAIGENGSGDILLLMPGDGQGQLADTLYWWNHETRELLSTASTVQLLGSGA